MEAILFRDGKRNDLVRFANAEAVALIGALSSRRARSSFDVFSQANSVSNLE
jgi:hypothetical protein